MIGIIADDITGANDIGIMYAKAGFVTDVYPMEAWEAVRHTLRDLPDVLVIDTGSRLDPPEEAYRKVRRMTESLREAGCTRFFNKTCSVFRGNVGAEFDAMLDALGEPFAVVVAGFPKNGRTTLQGIHFVRGQRLEDSEFRRDPVHPMTRSDLGGILGVQTKRRIANVPIEVVERGADALRAEIDRLRGTCSYLIADVRDQASLRVIAEAVRDEPVLGGSSGLSEELALLPDVQSLRQQRGGGAGVADGADEDSRSAPSESRAEGRRSVLCAAGSLMPQTAAQVAAMKGSGVQAYELDSLLLLSDTREAHIAERVEAVSRELEAGRDALLHASNEPGKVEETKRRARELGMSGTEISRLVSDSLALAVRRIAERTGCRRLLIAGGETSASVCAALGVGGLRIAEEIEPGLPSCRSLSERPLGLVLKSGSFGSESFLTKAAACLRDMELPEARRRTTSEQRT